MVLPRARLKKALFLYKRLILWHILLECNPGAAEAYYGKGWYGVRMDKENVS